MLEDRPPPTWLLPTGLCKLTQNISTDIWSMGKHRDFKIEQVSFLPISYSIQFFYLLYLLNSFQFSFALRDRENDL